MLGHDPFYNKSIRKTVVLFGTLFNELFLVRYDKSGINEYERIQVPLSYGPKEKFVTRLNSDPDLTKSIAISLPRMSFEMIGINYDITRKQTTATKNFFTSSGSMVSQYAPIPYDFDFTLSLYVRNQEDGTQLVEQILPFFTPDYTITADFIPELNKKFDIPIILNSINQDVTYEGDFSDTRIIIWTFDFTVKSFIFPPLTKPSGIIREVDVNFYADNRTNKQKVYLELLTGNGAFTINETVRVAKRNITGTVAYYSNDSTGTLVIENLTDVLLPEDIIQGDDSNAYYIIDTVDINPLKTIKLSVTPDPLNANADTAFGFTETIFEYPETLP